MPRLLWLLAALILALLLMLAPQWCEQAEAQDLNPSHPLGRGLIAWYPVLPHLTGQRWYDLVGGLHGTNAGSPVWAGDPTGRFEGTLALNGSQWTSLGNVAPLSFERTNPYTLSIWFATAQTGDLITKGSESGPNTGYFFQVVSGGELSIFQADTTGAYCWVATFTPWHNGLWHHGVVTYNGSAACTGYTLYVDGVAQSPDIDPSGTGFPGTTQVTDPVRFGSNSATTRNFVGRLSNPMIYNRVLSASEVQALYQMQAPTYGGLLTEDALPLVPTGPVIKRRVVIE